VRAFPWVQIDALKRADVEAARQVRAWAAARLDFGRLASAVLDLTGETVSLTLRSAGAADARVMDPGAVGVLLADRSARAVLVEVEAALAVALVGAALKRPRTRIVDPARASTPALAGAMGALLVACARRASNDMPLRVLACGSAAALWAEAHRLDPDRVAATFLVMVGDDAYVARASLPRSMTVVDPTPMDVGALGAVELEVPIVGACTSALPSEIETLEPGDAWIPGDTWISANGSAFSGMVALCAPAAELGARARLGEDGRLVLLDESISLPWQPEDPMSEGKDALASSLAEVPVVVRVEIGTAQMSARDWSRIAAGDVVTLGRRIGEHVVLRVAGTEVARGELVDVEGEIGVRIVSLARS
jgi:flagellar motor switch/type III secretory pathway protein FliN